MSLLWKTEKRKVSDLKAYDKNPRSISEDMFKKLKDSIESIGYVELVAIDKDNTIVAGHMRVKALIELGKGDEEIEVRVPVRKLTDEEFERYLIQSNKVTGSWDYNTLANVFDNDDLVSWGFSEVELGIGIDSEKDFSKANKEITPGEIREGLSSTCPKCGFEFSKEVNPE